MEPVQPGYSIFKGQKPEPKVVYTLPDGTTTIWLNEYTDALVKAERERIIKLLESIYDYPNGWDYDNPIESMIDLIRKESP